MKSSVILSYMGDMCKIWKNDGQCSKLILFQTVFWTTEFIKDMYALRLSTCLITVSMALMSAWICLSSSTWAIFSCWSNSISLRYSDKLLDSLSKESTSCNNLSFNFSKLMVLDLKMWKEQNYSIIHLYIIIHFFSCFSNSNKFLDLLSKESNLILNFYKLVFSNSFSNSIAILSSKYAKSAMAKIEQQLCRTSKRLEITFI